MIYSCNWKSRNCFLLIQPQFRSDPCRRLRLRGCQCWDASPTVSVSRGPSPSSSRRMHADDCQRRAKKRASSLSGSETGIGVSPASTVSAHRKGVRYTTRSNCTTAATSVKSHLISPSSCSRFCSLRKRAAWCSLSRCRTVSGSPCSLGGFPVPEVPMRSPGKGGGETSACGRHQREHLRRRGKTLPGR